MSRICSQVEDRENLAIDTLTWIVYAKRSLTSAELLHALAVEIDSLKFDDDNIPDIQDVLSACCGLIVVEPETQFVRLVHQTTQHFLKGHGSNWLPKAHSKLSEICNTYLALETLASVENDTEEDLQDLLEKYPLYDYASWHWLDHAQLRDDLGVEELVINQKQIDKSSEVLMAHAVPEYLRLRREYPGITGLHLLAYCGLTEMMPKFLERYDVNEADESGHTPLSYAFQKNNIEAFRMLLENRPRLNDRYESIDDELMLCSDESDHIGDPLLIHAINLEKYEMIPLLTGAGAKLDVKASELGRMLLSEVANRKNIDILQLLIENGANINHQDELGITPLLSACKQGNLEVMQLLLERGSDMTIVDKLGNTPLHLAAGNGHIALVKLLLKKNVDPNSMNKHGCRPICQAGYDSHIDIIHLLLDGGADISRSTGQGWAPLYCVSLHGFLDVANLLLDRGADINEATLTGAGPLHAAARAGHNKVVRLLLEKGADINKATSEGYGPLHVAAKHGHNKVVRLLLEKGADINKATSQGYGPLHIAAKSGHDKVVRLLLTIGADINKATSKGYGALYFAIINGHVEVVRLLLDRGADFDQATYRGYRPLHAAVINGHVDVVRLLLEGGADVNISDQRGWTPLISASRKGYLNTVGLLLDNGADPNLSTNWNYTPLCAAALGGHMEVFRLLNQIRVSVTAENASQLVEDNAGRNIFHFAAWSHNIHLVRYLLEIGTVPTLEDKLGRNTLDYASMSGSTEMIDTILNLYQANGIKIDSSSQWSALHWASQKGSYDSLKLLTDAGIKYQAVETKNPAVYWSPFDIAAYWNNRNLQSKDGAVRENFPWLHVLAPQTNSSLSASASTAALRLNELSHPGKYDVYCDGCFSVTINSKVGCIANYCRKHLAPTSIAKSMISIVVSCAKWM